MALEAMAEDMLGAGAAEPGPEWKDGAREAPPEPGPGLALPFEGFLNPLERRLALRIVEGLEPADPQEEMHSWHLAVTHLLAAERIGKSRQPDLPDRPQQIELGLAVRLMSPNQRESAALDRHRDTKRKAALEEARQAEKAAVQEGKCQAQQATARDADLGGVFLVVPEELSPQEWSRRGARGASGTGVRKRATKAR